MFIRHLTHMPKKSLAASRILVHFEGPSLLGEFLDTYFGHRADELRNVREPRFRGGGPPDGNWLACANLA